MADTNLTEYCVYTIKDPTLLADAASSGVSVTFSESKRWVTGHSLWKEAESENLAMPVLIGDAADCSRLLYWGLLTKVELTESGTNFTVDRVRQLDKLHTPQELELRSTGELIADNFIRPYAICKTPDFLCDS